MDTGTRLPHEARQTPKRGRHTLVIILVAVLGVIAGLIGTRAIVRSTMPSELINETADLDQSLIDQGTILHCSKNGVIREQGVIISVSNVGWDADKRPQVHFGFHAESDTSVGVAADVSLGDSLTLDGVGTIYLLSLTVFSKTQQISILFIPEN